MDNCPNTQDNLTRHLEGSLTDSEEQALRDHLAACPACAAAFKQMDLLEEMVKDAMHPETTPQLATDRIYERLTQKQVPHPQDVVPLAARHSRIRQWMSVAALLLIGVGLGIVLQSHQSQPQGPTSLKAVNIRITELKGTVLVKHQGDQIWQALNTNSTVYLGDTFHTTATSDFILALDKTNRIKVAQNSMLALESYDENETEFFLQHGQCTPVLNGPHGPFFVRTPNGRMEALGTEFTVKVTE
ncbi:FecR domain-containing protein [Planctomycetota bacterium]